MESKQSLWDYYRARRPKAYVDNWHLKWIADALERAVTERRNVIIEAPPRHSKSELSNVYFPAWRLSQAYDESFMLCTNSDQLAKKFSVASRALIDAELEVDRDSEWKIKGVDSLNYSYRSSGVRGQMTGHGASVLLFDDLVKNGQEAKSDTVRASIWDGVVSAAINRLTPDGIVVAMQSRLHQDDPLGRLLALTHMNWIHLHLPAVNDSGRDAWFRDGAEEVLFPSYDALWPQRYDRQRLDDIRETVSPYFWNAQYLAKPSMGDLAYFDVERLGTYETPTCDMTWIAVDAANTQTESGSFTAFVCLGYEHRTGVLKVLSVERGRWRQDVIHDKLVDFYEAMSRLTGFRPSGVIVERAAAGYGIIDRFSGRLPIVAVYPTGSKEDRAGSVCHVVNKGAVALPPRAAWREAFVDELQNFPLSSYNDMVDAFVHALSFAVRPAEFKFPDEVEVYQHDALLSEGTPLLDDFDSGEKRFSDGE